MIIIRKKSHPTIIYRTKPWKIGLMFLLPILGVSLIGVGTYFIVDNVNRRIIKYNFDIDSLKQINEIYSEKEVPQIDANEVKEILIAQFKTNQRFSIDTNREFKVTIIKGSSSAVNGVIKVNASFYLTDGSFITGEFVISGFKPQARPDYLPNELSVAHITDLNSIYPQDLVLASDPHAFDKNHPAFGVLKEFLFESLPNRPTELTIDKFDIGIQHFTDGKANTVYSPWGGYFNVSYTLDENIYTNPTYQKIVRLQGFKKYTLAPLEPNEQGVIVIPVGSEYQTKTASSVEGDPNLIKKIIVQYLRSSADEGPNTIPLSQDDIKIEINKVDNDNGQISLRNLQITKYQPTLTKNNLCLTGFAIQRPKLPSNVINIIGQFPEYQDYLATDVDLQRLQRIISNSLIKPSGLKVVPNDISLSDIQRNNDIGFISVKVTIPKFIVQPFEEMVRIENFKIFRPDPLNGVAKPYIVPALYQDLKPSALKDAALKRIILNYLVNKPKDLAMNDIAIINKKSNDADKTIIVSGNIPKYEARQPFNFEIKIIGFK